ncbi:single-stranded DNA-binding protein [Enterococcus sp. DIV0876]|uniref:single-stranded DNA-binding protein n=1 Tax=Enterococcus sp. DIV0876 TaxID=2774633 RepID=UPI003D2FB4DB
MAANQVILVGKIAEMTTASLQDATGIRFILMVKTNWQSAAEAELFECVIFGKQAETFKQYTQIDATIKVTGHLHSCPHQTEDGQRFCGAEVIVDSFQLLERPEPVVVKTEAYKSQAETRLINKQNQAHDPFKNQVLEFLKDNRFL